ncbi:PEP synthetase regulatory protein [Candidatus Endolissoclinum faulkneri L5]|uniref:Putative pyruvate, phosphate dikinase regulatory protein n=1 Tax=Candidatus Endolissoclinum faulkneri L5 TaxID=1401328 RepID=V9TU95_9PROT|nr:pyruvate, water dikinase regulatory protein [Candidatus Endolissoclinum faulkneri]AHC73253.1 PEP synthetase regulatory protein [Candidatus Endolissoclinum faulkneri L5]
MSNPLCLHLVSDATGETNYQIVRSCLVQFENIKVKEYVWSLVRTHNHLEKVIAAVKENPGPVLFTLVDSFLRERLEGVCQALDIPCLPVLDPTVNALAKYIGRDFHPRPGLQHKTDAAYFNRIEAINYTLAHDDGRNIYDLDNADIVIIGVSRTSKTPTSLYLANRGYKIANIPIVPNVPPPDELFHLKQSFIVAFTADPIRLVEIRRNRILRTKHCKEIDYLAMEEVRKEVALVRRMLARNNWPIIDITRRSIEETSAAVLQHLDAWKNNHV